MAKKIKKGLVSIIVITFNEEKYLKNCIESILKLKYKNFELVIVDDHSTDGSEKLIKSFKDKRIKYFKNPKNMGIAYTRNAGLKEATGEWIFFTDADCTVDPNWIDQGLKFLNIGYAAVEGKTYYLSEKPTISDTRVQNLHGNQYMTCNMAYSAKIIRKIGGFDYKHATMKMEDRDIAFRVMKHGRIVFNDEMLTFHAIKKWSFKGIVNRFKDQGTARVIMVKDHKDFIYPLNLSRIVLPEHLAVVLFPPLLIVKALRDRVRSKEDWKILAGYYLGCILERLNIWKKAYQEKIFLI